MQQQLTELSSLLQPLGLSHLVEQQQQHILHPGQRRTQLVQALLQRLMGGKALDAVCVDAADQYEALPEDERFARKCQSVLQLLGISTTPEQIRGCSGQQEQDTAPLLHMARLLSVMEARPAAASKPTAQPAEPGAGTSSGQQVTQLLAAAAAQLSKLLSENVQLFPSDMGDVLKSYSDQGAYAQLGQLCQHAVQRGQQLQQLLQQLLAAGASSCEGAGGEQWQELVQGLDEALGRQLQELQAFDAVYQQELSVWAGGASNQQQLQLQAAPWADARAGSGSAEATGAMARSLMAAYQELQSVMEALGTVMVQHQALKDVPVAPLQQQRDSHLMETLTLRMSTSTVRVLP